MAANQFVIVVIVVVALGIMGAVTTAGSSVDLGGPFRAMALARAARKLARERVRPATVERSYWSAGEYMRDAKRLQPLGYRVSSESTTPAFLSYTVPGRGSRYSGRTVRRRVPTHHVTYER